MNQSGGSAQDDLLRRAAEALTRRDPQSALGLIDQADAMGATHDGTLNRALALRLLGDFHGALLVLDDALAMQPYDFAALLGKAAMLEQIGQGQSAADVYRNALKLSPPR
ncbi:MAG: hypothetical protein KAY20_02340, partial [Brevundimonas sp.]|nr:hypothetical protein [Brevundimonas sp.]